ncbi:MAG: 4-hydroxy-tetrahydrodipicolinate synthase [Propionibacteriaceae bacterium]|nr:4-hydroxy-tetrahydrodipicolinate synthase [Propionibacteriaceae bacterium]
MNPTAAPIFGRLITAMVTPFDADGKLNLDTARRLAAYLVDEQHNDALVINGTTGEAPTTSDAEKAAMVKAVSKEVGDRAKVIAGVGTPDTAHSVELAHQAADAGAHGLLIVTPYYSLPPQDAIEAHMTKVASATDLPCLLYDIPHRTGRAIETETLLHLGKHPNIVGVKDAKKDLAASARVISDTGMLYYAGDDAYTLPMLSVGGVGVVGTSTHFTGAATAVMMEAFLAGRLDEAVGWNQHLLPVYTGVFATQGCMLVKAGLKHLGIDVGPVRAPLLDASPAQAATFAALLDGLTSAG